MTSFSGWARHNTPGVVERYALEDGKLVKHLREDVGPAIERAKRARDLGGRTGEGMQLLAKVPMSVAAQWLQNCRQAGMPDEEFWRMLPKLADKNTRGDYSKFRITERW